jgi:hypothetical protein
LAPYVLTQTAQKQLIAWHSVLLSLACVSSYSSAFYPILIESIFVSKQERIKNNLTGGRRVGAVGFSSLK